MIGTIPGGWLESTALPMPHLTGAQGHLCMDIFVYVKTRTEVNQMRTMPTLWKNNCLLYTYTIPTLSQRRVNFIHPWNFLIMYGRYENYFFFYCFFVEWNSPDQKYEKMLRFYLILSSFVRIFVFNKFAINWYALVGYGCGCCAWMHYVSLSCLCFAVMGKNNI